jgi:hypothetical protein
MTLLRTLALALAIGAIVDPALPVHRGKPAVVRMYAAAGDPDVPAVVARLRTALAGRVTLTEAGTGQEAVVVGMASAVDAVRTGTPVSVVSLGAPPAVSIAAVSATTRVVPGSVTEIRVALDGAGVTGQTTSIVLEEDGVPLRRREHAWKNDGFAEITLPYVAAAAGAHRVSIRTLPRPGGPRAAGSRADLLVMAVDRPARVAVLEARPSWPAGFARRALEGDDRFDVSSIVRLAKGVSSRAGEAPILQAQQLSRFDVLVVGAPEELRNDEVDAVWQFADRRGGTVVLLPDKAPGGAYAARLPVKVTEHLLAEPRALDPSRVMASEIVSLSSLPPAGRAYAALDGAPVIVSWLVGDGRVIFSGALDAWRYRADPKSEVIRFWRDELLSAALAAPPAVSIDVDPAVVRPGGRTRVAVRLRRTEFGDGGEVELPPVEAQVVDASGVREAVRLWPGPEAGMFQGEVSASSAGIHSVRVETNRAAAETSLVVAPDAGTLDHTTRAMLADLPLLTGGTAASADRLEPLIDRFAALPRPPARTRVRPFRSAWIPWLFAALLCGEWALRRRAGLR